MSQTLAPQRSKGLDMSIDQDEKLQVTEIGLAAPFQQMIDCPNIHDSLHYNNIATEYGCLLNVNVLIREDMHKSILILTMLLLQYHMC